MCTQVGMTDSKGTSLPSTRERIDDTGQEKAILAAYSSDN